MWARAALAALLIGSIEIPRQSGIAKQSQISQGNGTARWIDTSDGLRRFATPIQLHNKSHLMVRFLGSKDIINTSGNSQVSVLASLPISQIESGYLDRMPDARGFVWQESITGSFKRNFTFPQFSAKFIATLDRLANCSPWKYGSFRIYELGWQVAYICKSSFQGETGKRCTSFDLVAKDKWGIWNGVIGNPRALLISRLVQLALHDSQLLLKSAVLQSSDSGSNDSQNRNSNRSVGRSMGKTILGAFVLAVGAALMKVAFYFGDAVRPNRKERLLAWGRGLAAGLLIFQGTILALQETGFPKSPPRLRHPIPGPQGTPERTWPGTSPAPAYS